ncbi:MAG: phosphoenolpyruvate synthase [Pedosphaera sp.]|nr:phosphoenolpyruvate synthase [Pedosphaera sp.]
MDTIIVATFNERSKAGPIKQRLEEAHIPAEVHDESSMEKFWFVGKPLAGVRVKVPARDYEKACQLIHEWDRADGLLRDAVRCPECDSSRIEYPQYARKSVLPNIFGAVAAGLGLIEKEFYCMDCHYTWPKEGRKPSKSKPHMAPYYFIEGVPQKEPVTSGNR